MTDFLDFTLLHTFLKSDYLIIYNKYFTDSVFCILLIMFLEM